MIALERAGAKPWPDEATSERLLAAEARQVWELQQSGVLREIDFRADRHDAVLVMECRDETEARAALATLPLVEAELIAFDILPLKPYPGFARLFAASSAPRAAMSQSDAGEAAGGRDPVLAFLRQSCSSPQNIFGPEFVEEHLLVVERFALALADVLGADRSVVRLAALLHDVAAIEDGATIPTHAELGAQAIGRLCGPSGPLADALRLDEGQIVQIALCVREHSSPKQTGETTPESVCVSNADAMSQIVRPFYWCHYARTVKRLAHADAIAWYRSLVERNWNALIDAARAMIEPDYRAVDRLLRHAGDHASRSYTTGRSR